MATVPRTFLVGMTNPIDSGVFEYLRYTGQGEYAEEYDKGQTTCEGGTLVSMFAKLCYKSLTLGKNSNLTAIRETEQNLLGIIKSGHGAVMEHFTFNFITTNCSRVFTHELVRHRAGTAFSQTSGRYCRLDDMKLVLPPELAEMEDMLGDVLEDLSSTAVYLEKYLGLHGIETAWRVRNDESIDFATDTDVAEFAHKLGFESSPEGYRLPFAVKKRYTSAIRRIAPNGQANEIAWSVNWRALRHILELRTSRHAEWEIRHVFNEVANLLPDWVLMGESVSREVVDRLSEWKGLRV